MPEEPLEVPISSACWARTFPTWSRRNKPRPSLALVAADDLGLRQDVALHGALDVVLCCSGGQIELGVEGIELEEIAVRLSGGRARPAVADLREVVSALRAAALNLF